MGSGSKQGLCTGGMEQWELRLRVQQGTIHSPSHQVGHWAFTGGVREGISILVQLQVFPERFREEREMDRG